LVRNILVGVGAIGEEIGRRSVRLATVKRVGAVKLKNIQK